MKKKFTFLMAACIMLLTMVLPWNAVGQTYTKLTSIASIDETAYYVLGITYSSTDYYHYNGTSSWGKVATPNSQTPYYYSLTKGNNYSNFTASTKINNTTYYLTVPNSNFTMSTSSTAIYMDNNAHIVNSGGSKVLQYNHNGGNGGIRAYGNNNYPYAFFYKVTNTVTFNGNGGSTSNSSQSYTQSVNYNVTTNLTANAFERENYDFVGWSTTPNGTIAYTDGQSVKLTSDLTLYAQWESNSQDPTINVAITELSGFTYASGHGPSTSQSFTVSGSNLEANIGLSLDNANFELSTDNNSFSSTLSLPQTNGSVASTTVYVRQKASLNHGNKSATLTLTSQNAADKTIALSGTVTGYTVTYDKNGSDGEAPTDGKTYDDGEEVTVLGCGTMTKTGYTFAGWKDAGDNTYVENETFHISANTTLTAQWTINTYAYTLTVTGVDPNPTACLKVGNTTLDAGDKIDYNAEVTIVVTTSGGYGYSVAVKDAENNDVTVNDNKFNQPASTVTVTVTTEVNPYVYATLSSSDMQSMSTASENISYGSIKTKTKNDLTWETNGRQACPSQSTTPYGMIQLRKRNNGNTDQDPTWIKLPDFTGKIETITLSVTDAGNTIASPSDGGGKCKAIICFQGTNAVNATIITYNGDSSTGTYEITLDLSSEFHSTGFITIKDGSNAGRIWNISVKYRPYQDMSGTTLPTTLDEDVTISIPSNTNATASSLTIPASSGIVIKSGASLTVSGTLTNSGNANNIIIEDGGQLITSSAVDLTYKKSIVSAAKNGGWYTLSTPVHTGSNLYVTPSNVENLILSSDDTYDLFRYQESNHYWLNYKITAFNLNIGQGYIYRNDGHELHFIGTNNNSASYDYALSYSEAAGNLKGFNLIGNPYPQDITMSDVSVDGGSLTGGYVLSNAGGWSPDVAAKIAPTQGFLVQINQTGVTATISKPSSGEKSNHDYLKLIVANDQYEDVAFALFEEGYGLNKIDHRNSDIPMLYIPKGADNFAIATMSGETQSFNLNFKAKTTGKYTLSYKATRNYKYLHIIDRFTGEDVDMLLDGDYSFIGSPQDNAERFIVKLSYDNGSSTGSETFAYQSGNEIVVNGEGTLEVYDVTGRKVMNTVINGVETINGLNSGVYVFRVIGETLRTQKIVVR